MSFAGSGFLLLLASAVSAGVPSPEVRTVPRVDLQKYVGVWHEIARYPNRFQKHCDRNVTAEYSILADGRIRVVNRCLRTDGSQSEAVGVARVVDSATNAKLKVRFAPSWLKMFPFVWGDYWIIALADDYSYAINDCRRRPPVRFPRRRPRDVPGRPKINITSVSKFP